MRIDHAIYAAADLEAAAGRIEAELGLPAIEGGRHEGHGTINRIVPLGGGYLELVAIADPEEAERSAFGRAIGARVARAGDGLFGWALAVDDVDAVATRLGLTTSTISRKGLSARLAGLAEAMAEPFLPFFIARDPGVADPGAAGDGGGIRWLEIAGDRQRIATWIAGADLPIRVVAGALPGVSAIGIGAREFRT